MVEDCKCVCLCEHVCTFDLIRFFKRNSDRLRAHVSGERQTLTSNASHSFFFFFFLQTVKSKMFLFYFVFFFFFFVLFFYFLLFEIFYFFQQRRLSSSSLPEFKSLISSSFFLSLSLSRSPYCNITRSTFIMYVLLLFEVEPCSPLFTLCRNET